MVKQLNRIKYLSVLLLMLTGLLPTAQMMAAMPGNEDYQDGDVFTAQTIEGVEMTFKVISAEQKTCQVGTGPTEDHGANAIDLSTSGIVTIPQVINGFSVISIADAAFCRCPNITQVVIPEGVQSIGEQGMYGCESLTTLEIPASLTSLGYVAFGVLPSLTSIKVAEDNPVFDSRDNCNAIIQTSSLRLIKGCANTVIPDGVISLDVCCMDDIMALKSIELPSSLRTIGGWSFCETGLTSVHIPDQVYYIGYKAFSGCPDLTSFNLPASVTTIDRYAFYGCPSLESVYSYIQEPFAIDENVFEIWDYENGQTFTSATLYVPAGTKAKYEATEGWNRFQNIVEMGDVIDERQLMASKEIDGATYALYREIVSRDNTRPNYDGSLFYQTKVTLDITKDGDTNTFVIDDDLFTDNDPTSMIPCMMFDLQAQTMYAFCLTKTEYIDYGMDGYVYVSPMESVNFTKEAVFTDANWGWWASFAGLSNGCPQLYHFSFAGYYAMVSTREAYGGWWDTEYLWDIYPEDYKTLWKSQDLMLVLPYGDGVSSIHREGVDNSVIYNLSGQRLSKAQRGVNIINGKKVIVRSATK